MDILAALEKPLFASNNSVLLSAPPEPTPPTINTCPLAKRAAHAPARDSLMESIEVQEPIAVGDPRCVDCPLATRLSNPDTKLNLSSCRIQYPFPPKVCFTEHFSLLLTSNLPLQLLARKQFSPMRRVAFRSE